MQEWQTSNSEDKRYLPRWKVDNRVLYRLNNDQELKEAYSRDINSAGLCMCVAEDIAQGDKVKLTVFLAEETSVKAQGKVVWTRHSFGPKQVGILFFDLTDQTQDLILQYAFEVDKQQTIDHWFKGWDGQK